MHALARQRGRAALPPVMTSNDDVAIRLAPLGAPFAAVTVTLSTHVERREEAIR